MPDYSRPQFKADPTDPAAIEELRSVVEKLQAIVASLNARVIRAEGERKAADLRLSPVMALYSIAQASVDPSVPEHVEGTPIRHETINLEEVASLNIAKRLRDAGYLTNEAVAEASDFDLLSIEGIGPRALLAIRQLTARLSSPKSAGIKR